MDTPTRTTNLPAVSAIDEVLGNVTQDGVQRTRRISVESLALQLGGAEGVIPAGSVSNDKLADAPAFTFKGNPNFEPGPVVDMTPAASRDMLDPDEEVLTGEGLMLTYHKARGAWHVKAFGATLTEVGTGTTAADQAALAAAMASQEMIDLDGAVIQIEDPIVIDYSSANISARKSGRVGDTATSKIKVMDDTMPYLFDCQGTNFEASGFAIVGNETNTTTIAFNYKRPDGSARDIDRRAQGHGH